MRIGGLRLFGEVLPGAVAGEAGLVVGDDEGVAGDGVFLGVAERAVAEGLVVGLEFGGTGIGRRGERPSAAASMAAAKSLVLSIGSPLVRNR